MVRPCLSEGHASRSQRGLESVATNRASLDPSTRHKARRLSRRRALAPARVDLTCHVDPSVIRRRPERRSRGGSPPPPPRRPHTGMRTGLFIAIALRREEIAWGYAAPPPRELARNAAALRALAFLTSLCRRTQGSGNVEARKILTETARPPISLRSEFVYNLESCFQSLGGYRAHVRHNVGTRIGTFGAERAPFGVTAAARRYNGRPSAHMPTPSLYSYDYSYASA